MAAISRPQLPRCASAIQSSGSSILRFTSTSGVALNFIPLRLEIQAIQDLGPPSCIPKHHRNGPWTHKYQSLERRGRILQLGPHHWRLLSSAASHSKVHARYISTDFSQVGTKTSTY